MRHNIGRRGGAEASGTPAASGEPPRRRPVTVGIPHQGHRPLAGRRVLVVGVNYWPEPTGIAPYTTAMAEHLAGEGANVHALTGLPCYPGWQIQAGYRRLRTRELRNGVDVLRLAHLVPHRQDAARRAAYEVSFFAHAAAAGPRVVPDLVIGITPALAGAAAAARLARRFGIPLVVIVQDLVGAAAAQSGMPGGRLAADGARRLEAWVLRQADRVAIISDGFLPPLLDYGVSSTRVHTVPNWHRLAPTQADRTVTRSQLGWRDGETVALHSGNMGFKQGLSNVVRAARLTRHRRDLRWVLMGDGSQRDCLRQEAAGLPNLDFLPLATEQSYPDVLAASDVLLLNERAGVTEMSLPSKLTSYFASGRPVAAAVTPTGFTARELARAGAADPVLPDDPAALVQLVEYLNGPAGQRHAAACLEYAQTHLDPSLALRRLVALLP